MMTEGWQRSPYCWATPSSCFSRQGKKFSSNLNRDPRRRMGVHVVRAKLGGEATSRENDDDYQQFNSMLGDAPSATPQKADAKSAAYAHFAGMLGLEGRGTKQDESKKSVAKLSPKKVEIDPADYSLFDAMLERTGGTGTKPTKGGKRYTPHLMKNKKGARREIMENDADSQTRDSTDDHNDSIKNSHARHSLTAEEKAQAYAVMMEEFGPGVHDVVEAWTPDEDVDEVEPQSTQLLEPPKRPGDPRPVETPSERGMATPKAGATYQETGEEADSPMLETKPSRPFSDDQWSQDRTAKRVSLHDDMESTDMSASSPLEKSPLPQSLEDQPQRDENELMSEPKEANTEVQSELKPPPKRSSRDGEIENHKALVTESQQQGPIPSRKEDSHEDAPPVALPKPNRLHSNSDSTVSSHLQLDKNAGRSRSSSRKRFPRKQRSERDEPIEVLKNPKLIHDINE